MNHQEKDAPASSSQIKVPIRKPFHSGTEWTLERIDMCAKFRVRDTESTDLVAYYVERMKANEVFAPLRIVKIGRIHHLVDGHHRLAAYQAVQAKQATVEVTEGTWKDAMWFALEGNRTHGMPLTNAELRRVVQIVVEKHSKYSDRWIADFCHVNVEFVAFIRAQLGIEDPSQARRRQKKDAPDQFVNRPDARALPLAPNASSSDKLPDQPQSKNVAADAVPKSASQIVSDYPSSRISTSNPTNLVHRLLKFGASLRSALRIARSRKTTSGGSSPS